jgi:hypothetical protein
MEFTWLNNKKLNKNGRYKTQWPYSGAGTAAGHSSYNFNLRGSRGVEIRPCSNPRGCVAATADHYHHRVTDPRLESWLSNLQLLPQILRLRGETANDPQVRTLSLYEMRGYISESPYLPKRLKMFAICWYQRCFTKFGSTKLLKETKRDALLHRPPGGDRKLLLH